MVKGFPGQCKANKVICCSCQTKGHFSTMCRQRHVHDITYTPIHQMKKVSDPEAKETINTLTVEGLMWIGHVPLYVEIGINGHKVKTLVDTGVCSCIMIMEMID